MDQMAEVDYLPGEPKVTPLGSHRGFETVTYMIDGVFRHQDSNGGGGGLITDGDTQWTTAGAGLSLALITHLTSTASSAFLSLPCAVPSKSDEGEQGTRGAFVRGRGRPGDNAVVSVPRCLCAATCQQTASNKASQHHTLHRVSSKPSAC